MAMGDNVLDEGDFGVDKLSSHNAGGPSGSDSAMIKDKHRNSPIDGNQANPDHGPWRKDSK